MSARLAGKGVDAGRIVEIPNWATGTLGLISGTENELRREWQLEGKFVVLYSGNLGLAHEFETLLRGAEQAHRSVPALRLLFIGRGSRLDEVRRRVGELGIEAIVRFSDLLASEQLPESFGLAQLAVVTMRPGFEGLVVPSKLQGYMARGVPVLYIGPEGDMEQFINRSSGGIAIPCNDVAGVAAALVALAGDPDKLASLGRAGRLYYDDHFARTHGLAKYESVIRSVLTSETATP